MYSALQTKGTKSTSSLHVNIGNEVDSVPLACEDVEIFSHGFLLIKILT